MIRFYSKTNALSVIFAYDIGNINNITNVNFLYFSFIRFANSSKIVAAYLMP